MQLFRLESFKMHFLLLHETSCILFPDEKKKVVQSIKQYDVNFNQIWV